MTLVIEKIYPSVIEKYSFQCMVQTLALPDNLAMETVMSLSSNPAMKSNISHPYEEKRAATRYPVVWFVEFENGSGWTCDVSTTGACIDTDQLFACGVSIRFFLNQPEPQGWGKKVQCSGIVVWVKQTEDGWRMGVFMDAVHFEG
jgi:hypothetical protein